MKKPAADQANHGDSEFAIYIASDDGKYYRIRAKELEPFEIKGRDKATKKDVKVLEMLRRHGVAFAGVEEGDEMAIIASVACRKTYFVNLAHAVPVPKGKNKP